jgi:hypothetical protein
MAHEDWTLVANLMEAFSRVDGLRVEDGTVGCRQKRASRRDEKGEGTASAVFLALEVPQIKSQHPRGKICRFFARWRHFPSLRVVKLSNNDVTSPSLLENHLRHW